MSGAPATQTLSRVHALDGLRAVAATLVVGHHLGANAVADALDHRGMGFAAFVARTIGASGVELFFVLSGVVLTRPYVRGLRQFRLPEYLRRRAERLFPPYILAWLLAGGVIYLTSTWGTWWTSTASLPHFVPVDWLLQAVILSFGPPHYSFVWWSLGVEVMFYLLVPLLIPLVMRLPQRAAASVAVLAPCVALALWLPAEYPGLYATRGDVGQLIVYLPCFAAGLLLARTDWSRRVAFSVGIAGALLLALAYAIPLLQPHVGYGLLYVAIVSRACDRKGAISRLLGRWHFVWLGERSYSLFLMHAPVIVMTYYLASKLLISSGGTFILVTRLVAVPVALFVAMLSFHLIERRFARGLITGESFWPVRPKPVVQPDTHLNAS